MNSAPGTVGLTETSQAESKTPGIVVPQHVAVIMDGNGRWAVNQGKSRSEGHRAGTNNVRRIVKAFSDSGVKYLTLFAFSTENWDRPSDEVGTLLSLILDVIRREVQDLHEEGVKICHLGRLDRLNDPLNKAIQETVELTKNNTHMTLNVAFDYGGRAEILNAVRNMISDNVNPDEICEELFGQYLYTSNLPDPDLIIRTAGEMRLSNFLIWQAAYAEYYSASVYWPDFDEKEVAKALEAYSQRQRRFGRVK